MDLTHQINSMNILFLNPPFLDQFSRTSRSPAVCKGGTLYYPLWLAYATAVAEQAGHNVRLIDAPALGLDIEGVFNSLDGFVPEIAVIDTSTPSIFSDVHIAGTIKDQYPASFIVMVGTHPSALPEQTVNLSTKVDAVAIGEYDYTIRDLAGVIMNKNDIGEVDGLVFRKDGVIVRNKEREKIKDLDNIPFVSSVYKKHLNCRKYFFAAANYPMMMIITGRGCPFKCFFCVYPQVFHARSYRTRSPENVVDEFEYIVRNFPDVKEIGIEDDCFSADRKRVKKICELIIGRGIKIKWYCNVRGDLDYDLLKLMKSAGCRLVTVGFESGCQQILDKMCKGERVEVYYKFADSARKAGVLVHGCIMVGNPGDTKTTLMKSYEFSKKINCDSMQFYPLYVYPGTEAYSWAKEHGYLKTEDFSQWLTNDGLHNCVINTASLKSEEMVSLCDDYLKKYHLRFAYMFMKLKQAIKDPSEGYRSLKSARVFFSKYFMGQLGRGQ
ncbi:MAG: radical SAM protein [Pseudomonadota bacterium]